MHLVGFLFLALISLGLLQAVFEHGKRALIRLISADEAVGMHKYATVDARFFAKCIVTQTTPVGRQWKPIGERVFFDGHTLHSPGFISVLIHYIFYLIFCHVAFFFQVKQMTFPWRVRFNDQNSTTFVNLTNEKRLTLLYVYKK